MDDAYVIEGYDDHFTDGEYDVVDTMDVQILLSWYFETADPADLEIDYRKAA